MMYLQPKFTVPAAPETIRCCEACVYGRGEHADWCEGLTDEFLEEWGMPQGWVRTGHDPQLRVTYFRVPRSSEDLERVLAISGREFPSPDTAAG